MPLRGDLLTPISGPNLAGSDLRYDPLFDKIKDARQEDDSGPQGDWQRPRKAADFGLVAKLAGDALATRSKDLWLAAWLTEAQLRREGLGGLRSGIELLLSLLSQFWDVLYPGLEDGDPELRAAPLSWVGLTLGPAVRSVPLSRAGHDFFKYKESRAVGYEAEASSDTKRLQTRQQAIEEGKLAPEEFDKGFEATPKAWYKALAGDLDGCVEGVAELDRLGRDKFGDAAPSYARLEEALTEVRHVVRQLLAKKLEIDPDPPEPVAPAAGGSHARTGGDGGPTPGAAGTATMAAGDPVDREDATARAVAAAEFLRRTEPHSPASYLLLRGLRWGEVRADGNTPDPRLLEAPSTQVRTHLKGLLLDAKWAQLLESAERTMATPAGRGWLDLQRFTVSACAGLGGQFDTVARAVQGALRALLTDVPGLLTMTLMDDMPTANQETRQWLQDQGLTGGGQPAGAPAGEAPGPNGATRTPDPVLERAMVEARAGRSQRGIELLMGELAKEKSVRARFLRRTQIARLMVESGLEPIAVPILQELLALIETHRLSDWEAGELVAEPMALLYRCIEKLPEGAAAGEHSPASLYPRICSLDPLQALTLTRPA
jgi:type VI secretion system protein ImpA